MKGELTMSNKKKLLIALIALVLVAVIAVVVVVVVSNGKKTENKTITIGATATPHALILEEIREDYAALGYDMDIVVVSDYYISNPSTAAGEMDCNFFQHVPFLDEYNKSVAESEQLVAAIGVHCEPYGIYPGTKANLAEIADGDKIAITNDPSNLTRALLLLSDAGLLELPEGSDWSSTLTSADVVSKCCDFEIVEMNAELIPSMRNDVTFAVINGNYAIDAGLSVVKDALFTEAEGLAGQAYVNYVVTRPEDVEADWLVALKQVLCSEKVYNFIVNSDQFKGGVVPAFTVEAK